MAIPPELRTLALSHDGVITIDDARGHGLSGGAISRRVNAGEWVREGAGIYRLADHPVTGKTRTRLATLQVSAQGILSGLMAAWWHGVVSVRPSSSTVTAPVGWHGSPVKGAVVVRRTLDPADVVVTKGLQVTALPLSVLEGAVEGRMSSIARSRTSA